MEETHSGDILSSYTTYVLEALLFSVISGYLLVLSFIVYTV